MGVITSYSIHYTKLYDNAASLDELVIDSDPNSCKANIERTAKDLDVSGEVLKAIAQVESDYNPYAVNFEGKSFIRITSYNVCYTKLLRLF